MSTMKFEYVTPGLSGHKTNYLRNVLAYLYSRRNASTW